MNRFFLSLFCAPIALLTRASIASACSVCLTGATNDPTANAFNWSVLFLMATPYTVVGAIAGWLVYTYRRAAAKRAEVEREHAVPSLVWNTKENQR